MPSIRSFTVLPALPDSLKDLNFLARNLFWCWNPEIMGLFKRIDSNLWESCGHNPVKLLGSVSQQNLESLAENQGFLSELYRSAEKLKSYLSSPTWFDKAGPQNIRPTIAYFSAEIGIHECLPIYSGGLGVLAGDYLKSASDMGVPLVGVGLLYQKGYFRQYLNVDGWQQEAYVENDYYSMPIKLIRKNDGQPLTITVEYPNGNVDVQIWCVNVGRVKLYLLDTNLDINSPEDRLITANLYGGDREMRIRQEIMLGIGGLRALMAAGITPTVCHINEGHAAFMVLERIRQLLQSQNLTFEEAMEATKAGNVFTIHTPVKAGNDEFPREMIDKYFKNYYPQLSIDEDKFLSLGMINADSKTELFKMPVLALKLSSCRNGVSQLHGEVSRRMWTGLWPEVPISEVPITSITNGVHIKSWLSEEMDSLYERYLGHNWTVDDTADKSIWENIKQIPDEELWRTHQRCKERLIAFSRRRLKAQLQKRGTYHSELNWAEEVLDPEALTIGFARRFAAYKRGDLLLKNPQRLIKLLKNPERPVQIIFAGKAHPKDTEGKEVIRQIIHFGNQYDVRRRVVFIEDYDLNVARYLVQGVDIWLNNPRPPFEASGTSGMKAAFNGALNMSTLDGWWCEANKPEIGWTIGCGEGYDNHNYQDTVESKAIYNMLENEVVPLFYTRTADNLPRAWISRMKNSIKLITPQFNTDRMVADYTHKFYNNAAVRWQRLNAESMSRAKALSRWKSRLKASWSEFAIKDVQIQIKNGQGGIPLDLKHPQLKVGSKLIIRALVELGKTDPNDVSVELYHGSIGCWRDITHGSAIRMDYNRDESSDNKHWFEGTMTCRTSGRQGLAVRVLPNHADIADPYEMGLILWESNTDKEK